MPEPEQAASPEQVRTFIPPGTLSHVLHSIDPAPWSRSMWQGSSRQRRFRPRPYSQWKKPQNRRLVLEPSTETGRTGLIGCGRSAHPSDGPAPGSGSGGKEEEAGGRQARQSPFGAGQEGWPARSLQAR